MNLNRTPDYWIGVDDCIKDVNYIFKTDFKYWVDVVDFLKNAYISTPGKG